MTPEELDEARAKEAWRIWNESEEDDTLTTSIIAARLAREGWTPPEPVDPDLLAFREWFADKMLGEFEELIKSLTKADYFLAGARAAREQERERAGPLVEYVWDDAKRPDGAGDRARKVLAKYEGTL